MRRSPRHARLADRSFARSVSLAIGALLLTGAAAGAAAQATAPSNGGPGWVAVQRVLGGTGTMQPGNVLKFGFPRSDLHVTAGGIAIRPALALGSWVAFKRVGTGANASAIVMGDLVLTEDEVAPVMQVLQQGGVQQTALHNHLLHESPHVMYMHVMANGDPVRIATAIRAALGASATPLPTATVANGAASAAPAALPTSLDLDTARIAATLRASGKVNGGVYQVSVPRTGRVTDDGVEIPPSMGVATGINFLTERPRLFFMHFWANDDAVKLASGLGAALDRMAVRRTASDGARGR